MKMIWMFVALLFACSVYAGDAIEEEAWEYEVAEEPVSFAFDETDYLAECFSRSRIEHFSGVQLYTMIPLQNPRIL